MIFAGGDRGGGGGGGGGGGPGLFGGSDEIETIANVAPVPQEIRHPYIYPFRQPFAGKSLQIYNEFVLTVSRLNRDMNNSLSAVRLLIRKPGPHNSRSPVGTLK